MLASHCTNEELNVGGVDNAVTHIWGIWTTHNALTKITTAGIQMRHLPN